MVGASGTPEQMFRDRVIRLSVESRDGAIRNARYDGCHIEGPAVILPTASSFTHCRTAEGVEHVFWDVSNLVSPINLVGYILVDNCIFDNCTFINIGMSAPEPFLTRLKAGWQS